LLLLLKLEAQDDLSGIKKVQNSSFLIQKTIFVQNQ